MNKPAIGLLALLLLTSCSRTLYVPNSVNAPLFSDAGDYKVALNTRVVSPFNLELQTAYSPIKYLAVMGNGYVAGHKSASTETETKYRFGELGVGTYAAFWEDACKHDRMRVELFGGYGGGNSLVVDDVEEIFFPDPTVWEYKGSYRRTFLQPSLGIKTRFVDFLLTARFSDVQFDNYTDRQDGVLVERGTYNFTTIEPVFGLGFGYNNFKLITQFGFVEALDGPDSDYYKATGDTWANTHFHVGFSFGKWEDKCPPTALISLRNQSDSLRFPPPPSVVSIRQSNVKICLQDGGDPDGDRVSASFNGAFVLPETELSRKLACVEVQLLPDADNLLQIHAISNGERNPNTLRLSIYDGNKRRVFFLLTEAGRVEEVVLRLAQDGK